ncbi:MAG: sigma-54-dependent Fis family transcriptional regulator [Deltaproteobacteria bacterium]|nr:sigma-54-dependent Fis family transcriptional regulator [Deltaproteobacteria bacterium]
MGPHRVAVIDDEPIVGREIKRGLTKENYLVETFLDGESALKRMSRMSFDLVLCDLRLPGKNGLEVLQEIKSRHPLTEVIIITGQGSLDSAIEAVKAGAFHYVAKPIKMAEIRALAGRAVEKSHLIREKEALKKALYSQNCSMDLIGHSQVMQEVLRLIDKIAPLGCNVLIQGESGTGKELVAQALHYRSPRRDKPFVSFNCGGFSEELVANELFGHEKGAFTGATESKIGLLEAAHLGTIFLDEIGEMPHSMQVKILRFIQERTLLRVGGIKPIPVDVRLIAAGNIDFKEAITQKKFREDLYYRLNVVTIPVPPLRSRSDDIPLLAKHFLAKFNQAFGKNISSLEKETLDILQAYPFPGNVRELENIIERAVALTDTPILQPQHLPPDLQKLTINRLETHIWPSLEDREREYIQEVLIKTNFQKGLAADLLKIPRTTLWRKMNGLA